MTTTTLNNNSQYASQLGSLVRRGWRINRSLTAFILICLAMTAFGIVAIMVDPRTIGGQSVWTKPVKFGISNAIYCATILVLFGSVQPRPRWVNRVFNLTSVMLAIGMAVIASQAARATGSHYNFSTTYDTIALSIMGLSTLTLSIVSLLACVYLVRSKALTANGKPLSRPLIWSLKLGLLVTVLVGFSVGTLMMRPSDSQMAKMQTGAADAGSIMGAHTIGSEDGGPGLPILGWSTTDGDLRPAHFFGLHALQIVPLLGLFIASRREQWLAEGHRLSLVVIGALAYTGFIVLTAWQALQGEPLVSPSTQTLAALAILIGSTVLAAGATVLHGYRSAEKPNL